MNGMEKKQETKKTKSLTQKAKKIRSIIMMTLLCVLMMSAATYAWFTLSNTAKATNLTMTVGDTTGLQIAPDTGTGAGTFGSSITFNDIKGTILPATTSNGINFFKPIYGDDGEVSSTEATTEYLDEKNTDTNKEGYYIQYTFYLKSLGADSDVKRVVVFLMVFGPRMAPSIVVHICLPKKLIMLRKCRHRLQLE